MKRLTWIFVAISATLLAGTGLVLADRDDYEHEEHEEHEGRGFFSRWMKHEPMAFNTQQNQLYQEECGSCHFPFQPGLLPVSSWQAIMGRLEDHFGENAELGDETRQKIAEFLLANSAGVADREVSNKVSWSLRYESDPLRVTETPFFRHEHREIPPRVMHQPERELSFANCDSCHPRALQGSFNEHDVRIPGIGRWED